MFYSYFSPQIQDSLQKSSRYLLVFGLLVSLAASLRIRSDHLTIAFGPAEQSRVTPSSQRLSFWMVFFFSGLHSKEPPQN